MQACRTWPLTSIVQAPQTSSRQLQSQATGGTRSPSTFLACAAIRCSTLMTFMSGFAADAMPFPIAGLARRVLPQHADVEFGRLRPVAVAGVGVMSSVRGVRRMFAGGGLHRFSIWSLAPFGTAELEISFCHRATETTERTVEETVCRTTRRSWHHVAIPKGA